MINKRHKNVDNKASQVHFMPEILIAINARNMSTITFHYHIFISTMQHCNDFFFCFEGALAIVLDYSICAQLSGGVEIALICLLFICSQLPVYHSAYVLIFVFVVAFLIAQSIYLLIYFYPSLFGSKNDDKFY